jgi:hypothetical protein
MFVEPEDGIVVKDHWDRGNSTNNRSCNTNLVRKSEQEKTSSIGLDHLVEGLAGLLPEIIYQVIK